LVQDFSIEPKINNYSVGTKKGITDISPEMITVGRN
jgi:hypothetical protein